jgi:curli production assembly/transport component CsgF
MTLSLSRFLVPGMAASALAFGISAAAASSLTYQPTNPNFGGSPLNGSWLQSQAGSQNEYQAKRDRLRQILSEAQSQSGSTSPGQQFAQQLQAQLYGSLANQITEAIFGENAQQSGSYSFGGTTIRFQHVGSNIELNIFDGQTTTTVTVPASP